MAHVELFRINHGKSLCDANASHCKSLFRRLAIAGESINGAAGYVSILNNSDAWQKSKEERDVLFRTRDDPRPIVADSDTSEKYEWSEMVAVRICHCLRCKGAERVDKGVTSYELVRVISQSLRCMMSNT